MLHSIPELSPISHAKSEHTAAPAEQSQPPLLAGEPGPNVEQSVFRVVIYLVGDAGLNIAHACQLEAANFDPARGRNDPHRIQGQGDEAAQSLSRTCITLGRLDTQKRV